MSLEKKIAELPSNIKASTGSDLQDMKEDIYYYFTELDQFEVLKIDQKSNSNPMIIAACLSTMTDPFFKIVVAHTWQKHLSFDNEWSEFEQREGMAIFRFLTWEDEYVCGEIWFERAKLAVQ